MQNIDNLFTSYMGRKDLNLFNKNLSLDSYKVYEKEDNIIIKCLAPSYEEKDIDLSIESRILEIKSNKKLDDTEFCFDINNKFKLFKEIDSKKSFASLEKGILTITMPLKKCSKKTQINFK